MRRKIRFNKDADFIFLTYSTVRNVYQTAAILGIPARYVREVLAQREGLFVPARSTRLKVLKMYNGGKAVKQIAKELGVTVDWVYKTIERHKPLDRLSDISIIPHPPFPKEDSFELKKEHRNRLEKLREAKVKEYRKKHEQ